MKEVWKNVIGYEGLYQVSSKGRLRALERNTTYFTKNGKEITHKRKARLLSPTQDADGYMKTTLTNTEGVRLNKYIHQLVAQSFLKNPNNKPCVNHLNGVRDCNDVENLEWTTIADNNKHGRLRHEGLIPNSTLTKTDVKEIRFLNAHGVRQKTLAKIFEVNVRTIYRTISRERHGEIQ